MEYQRLVYLTLGARKNAMKQIGKTCSNLIEDALIIAGGIAVVALAVGAKGRR